MAIRILSSENITGSFEVSGKVGIGTAPTSRNLSVFRSTAGSVANFLHYTDALNFAGLYIGVSQSSQTVSLNASGSSGGNFEMQCGNATALSINNSSATFSGDVKIAEASNKGQLFFGTANTDYEIKGGGNYGYLSLNAPILRFDTGGTERMRIKSDGVITFSKTANTTTPVASINHASNDFVYFSGGASGGSFGDDSHSTRMIAFDSDYLRFDTAGSERMRINSSGNVGVGVVPGPVVAGNIRLDVGTLGCGITSRQNFETVITANADYGTAVTTGKPATRLYMTNGGEFQFETAPANTAGQTLTFTPRMVIKSGGNVGIGTTVPNSKLTIEAAGSQTTQRGITLFHNNTLAQGYISVGAQYTATNGYIDSEIRFGGETLNGACSFIGFATGCNNTVVDGPNSEKMRIDSSGNVKVGRSSGYGNSRIQSFIASTANFATPAYLAADSTNMATGVGGEISFIGKYATGVDDYAFYGAIKGFKENATDNNTACALGFYTRPTATLPIERMRIDSSGNVGIGTTSPSATFQVGGGTANVLQKIWGSGTAGIQIFTNSPSSGTKIISLEQYFSNEGYLGLYYNGTEKVRFRSNDNSFIAGGNLGIGTTSPATKLHVENTNAAIVYVKSTVNNQNASIFFNSNSGGAQADRWEIGTNISAGSDLEFFDRLNSVSRMVIQNDGNVGIGTTSPGYKLDVQGTIRATGDVIAYSDARVKDNVKTIDNALDKVTKLRGVSYNRKDIEDKSTKIGVIAQEVKDILPEVVEQDMDDKYSVAYGNMAGVFIEAIKELKSEIEELKNKPCACNNCNCKEL